MTLLLVLALSLLSFVSQASSQNTSALEVQVRVVLDTPWKCP